MHLVEPDSLAYLPTVEVNVPATQAVQFVEPAVLVILPAGQWEQAADPGETLYIPATHCVHGPPSAPVLPALQVQELKLKAPGLE